MQISLSVDQEFALTCLRLIRMMKKLAVVLEKLPPGAFVLLTAQHHPGVDAHASDFGFLVGAVGNSMNLSNVPASIGSSYARLCRRKRPGRFRCGGPQCEELRSTLLATHQTGSWRRRTDLLLMTPSAVPIK